MLSELFEEILDSEKSFKEKVDRLRALADSVEKSQKELDAARVEVETLQGEVLVKSQRLSELKVDVCSHNVAVGALRGQEGTLQAEKEELVRQLAAISEEVDREREAFLVQAASFGSKFSLGSDTKRVTEERLVLEAAALEEEVALLQAELAENVKQRVGVRRLSEELERAREELLKEEAEAEEATAQARASKEELLAAEREYERLLQWSTSDPEFVRLQTELGQHRQGQSEEVCRQLRRELEAVQEEYYTQQWRKAKGGGGAHLWKGHKEPAQMHRRGVQQQCVSGRSDLDDSPSSSPADASADSAWPGTVGVQSSPLPFTGEGSTPPDVTDWTGTAGRTLSPQQQAIRTHQPSHSSRVSKTGPFGGWKRPVAVPPKDFTSAAGCMPRPLPTAATKKVRFQY